MIVAATLSPAAATKSAASLVVICSNMTFKFGYLAISGLIWRSINTFSRSNTSTSASVTSACTNKGNPAFCMAAKVSAHLSILVTPESEFVVAPAGYNFTPYTRPLAFAFSTSSALVFSVKYKVIKGLKSAPSGKACTIRSR